MEKHEQMDEVDEQADSVIKKEIVWSPSTKSRNWGAAMRSSMHTVPTVRSPGPGAAAEALATD